MTTFRKGQSLKVLRATLPDERKVKVTVGNPPFPAGSVVTGILPAYEAIRKSFERIRLMMTFGDISPDG